MRFWIGTEWQIALANISAVCICGPRDKEDTEYDEDDDENDGSVEIWLEGDDTSIKFLEGDANKDSFLATWANYTADANACSQQMTAPKVRPEEVEAARMLIHLAQQSSHNYDSDHRERIHKAADLVAGLVNRLL